MGNGKSYKSDHNTAQGEKGESGYKNFDGYEKGNVNIIYYIQTWDCTLKLSIIFTRATLQMYREDLFAFDK